MFPTSNRNSKPFTVPNTADVLCGRGLRNFLHQGNCRLREQITTKTSSFAKCKYRREKTRIIDSVIKSVMREGGRFLKYDYVAKSWYDGGLVAAKQRVGIAFRDATTPRKMKRSRFEAKGDWKSDAGNDSTSSFSSHDNPLPEGSEIGFEISSELPACWKSNVIADEPNNVCITDNNRDTYELGIATTQTTAGNSDDSIEFSIAEAESWMQMQFGTTDGNYDNMCELSITAIETWMQVQLDDTFVVFNSDEERRVVCL